MRSVAGLECSLRRRGGSRGSRCRIYRYENHDFFPLHAGTAFEALGKALLADAAPVLPVELGHKHPTSL